MYPTTPIPNNIKITSVYPNLVSVSNSFKRQIRNLGVQRWLFDVKYPLLTREQLAPIWAFAVSQEGQYGIFDFIPYKYGNSNGNITGSTIVANNYSTGTNTVAITGNTGYLKPGDFIKFANHNKVYMVNEHNIITNEITFTPKLHAGVSIGIEVIYNDVPFSVAFTNDETNIAITVNNLVSHSVKLVEIV